MNFVSLAQTENKLKNNFYFFKRGELIIEAFSNRIITITHFVFRKSTNSLNMTMLLNYIYIHMHL